MKGCLANGVVLQYLCMMMVPMLSWGLFLEGLKKFSGPESHNKNLKSCVYRGVLFTQFNFHAKFNAYTLLSF